MGFSSPSHLGCCKMLTWIVPALWWRNDVKKTPCPLRLCPGPSAIPWVFPPSMVTMLSPTWPWRVWADGQNKTMGVSRAQVASLCWCHSLLCNIRWVVVQRLGYGRKELQMSQGKTSREQRAPLPAFWYPPGLARPVLIVFALKKGINLSDEGTEPSLGSGRVQSVGTSLKWGCLGYGVWKDGGQRSVGLSEPSLRIRWTC